MARKQVTTIIWEGNAVYVTHTPAMANVLGPFAVCVHFATHGVIVGRTDNRARAIRVAEGLDRYPAKARAFAGLT